MAEEMFGNLVKTVVDVEKEVMAVNGELHADEEALLLSKGSKQKNLWDPEIRKTIVGVVNKLAEKLAISIGG